MGRLLRPALLTLTVVVLAAAFTLAAAVTFGGVEDTDAARRATTAAPLTRPAVLAAPGTDLAALQQRLRRTPRDHRAWSTLALAYVEQARITADPSYYARADEALSRAAALAPGDPVLLTARASLATARHEFTGALRAADRAIAANPYSAAAHAVRADALTELGRYGAARAAARRADDLEPGPSTFARLSYAAELRGNLPEARRLMALSRDAAGASAPSYAFAAFHLGELARAAGELRAAGRHYAAALEADPAYAPAVLGRARLAVARGEIAAALRDYRAVVARRPLPEYVVELAELYLSLGRTAQAREQLAVAAAAAALAEANGVGVDLETALVEADHGSPAKALAAARAEWAARQSIHAADALGWALHAAGRDAAALRYARLATRLGTRDAAMLFHRGAIEAALGLDGAARRHLRASLALDAGVAPWREQRARELLAGIGDAP